MAKYVRYGVNLDGGLVRDPEWFREILESMVRCWFKQNTDCDCLDDIRVETVCVDPPNEWPAHDSTLKKIIDFIECAGSPEETIDAIMDELGIPKGD